ncbi:hypothetical protein [Geodermatophilus siccatus]|uniref:hypothetical protein n=1 Tax=Geodermatophilus siccatus TaxID=1137991 RepID=UPI000B891F78|nr:hypothetical protein [Geodermatophilus siccatus]
MYDVNVWVPGVKEPYRMGQVLAKATSERKLPSEAGTDAESVSREVEVSLQFVGVSIATIGAQSVKAALPHLEFRDSAGRVWQRDERGRLTPLRQEKWRYTGLKMKVPLLPPFLEASLGTRKPSRPSEEGGQPPHGRHGQRDRTTRS